MLNESSGYCIRWWIHTVRSKPILLKSILCGLNCWVFLLLLIYVVYIMDFFGGAFFVGLPCGIIIALVTSCETLERTIKARVVGILSALVSQFLFTLLGIPYAIILYIYRNDEWVKYSGRLSVNEMIGYGWGRFFFWGGLLASFVIKITSQKLWYRFLSACGTISI